MILRIWRVFQYDFPFNTWYGWRKKVLKLMTKTASSFVKYLSTFTQKSYFKISFRDCVRNLDLRVQVHPGELLVSKSVGAHSTRSLKISGCKWWCPKDLRVCAPSAPVLTHSLVWKGKTIKWQNCCKHLCFCIKNCTTLVTLTNRAWLMGSGLE